LIYLHKFLPMFLLPTGLIILLLAASLLWRKRSLTLLALVIFTLASNPWFSDGLMQSIEGSQQRSNAAKAPQADAVVVLSGGRVLAPGPDAISEWADADRFWGGVELIKAQKAPLLIFTGGWVPWEGQAEPEGEVLMRHAKDLGIPSHQLALTQVAHNTAQEALAVRELLMAKIPVPTSTTQPQATGRPALPTLLLVTSAFHMPRAQALFERQGFQVHPFPVDFQVSAAKEFGVMDFLPSARAFEQTELALREWYGRLYYRWVAP
jgi:uncharacterized SAM-binding protein YcdF (DUF218 family)